MSTSLPTTLPFSTKKSETRAIHLGQEVEEATGTVISPLYTSSIYELETENVRHPKNTFYGRFRNPTRHPLEQCITSLERGNYGIAFCSGIAAIEAVISTLEVGDRVVCSETACGGTQELLRDVCKQMEGYAVVFSDINNPDTLVKELEKKTKLVIGESINTPTMRLSNIETIADMVHRSGAILAIDNSLLTPLGTNPLDRGADITIHSGTQYLNGHGDLNMGFAVTKNKELADAIWAMRRVIGSIPSPMDCFLMKRSIKSLHVRFKQHIQNAMVVAKYLDDHTHVSRVFFQGHQADSQNPVVTPELIKQGLTGIISFHLRGSVDRIKDFLSSLKLVTLSTSIGAMESLICYPATMTHNHLDTGVRNRIGITDSLVRLSVGLEDSSDIIEDLDQALRTAFKRKV